MASLGDYFANEGGLYGAFLGGEQRATEQQAAAAKAPLELEKQRLANETSNATLQDMLMKNEVNRSQVPNQIEMANSSHGVTMDANRAKKMGMYGQKLSHIGALLEQVPPPARVALFQQYASENGIGFNNPDAQQFLKSDPRELPGLLSQMGKEMALSSAEHIQKMAQDKAKDDAAFRRQKYSSDSSLEGTKYTADAATTRAGMKGGDTNASFETALIKLGDARKQYSTLIQRAQQYAATDPDYSEGLMARAEAIRPAAEALIKSATPGGVDASAMGLETIKGPNIAPQNRPTAPAVKSLPQGSRQIGTSKGKPVYETPDGKRFIGE